jgi:arylsulfatase A-like enzyme
MIPSETSQAELQLLHKSTYHTLNLHEELLRVPLIIKYPPTSPRRGVVTKRVSLVDLFPTVLSFLGYPVPPGIDGEALEHSKHPVIAEAYTSSFSQAMGFDKRFYRDLKAIYQGNEKYIWASNALNELYNLEKDPGEEENLITRFPHKAEAMQKTLEQWVTFFKPRETEGEAVKINKSTEERLRALGYIR